MWWYKGPYCVFYHMTRCLESVIKVSVLMFWWNILACDKKKKGHSALNILCSWPTCVTLCRLRSPRPLILGSWSPVLHAWCKILDKLEKYLWPWCKQWSSNREKYIIKQQSDILSALFVTQNMYYYEYYIHFMASCILIPANKMTQPSLFCSIYLAASGTETKEDCMSTWGKCFM